MTLTKIDDRGLNYPLDLLDNEKIRLGTGNDLEIFHHSSSFSFITNNTGIFHLRSVDGIKLQNQDGSEMFVNCIDNGAVELYHNGGKKLETTAAGATITGSLTISDDLNVQDNISVGDTDEIRMGDGNEFTIYHAGNTNHIESHNATPFHVEYWTGSGYEYMAKFIPNGAAELYYDNNRQLLTAQHGIVLDHCNLFIRDNKYAAFGTGDDFKIYHDGNNSYINNTAGYTVLNSPTGVFIKTNNEHAIDAFQDGAVKLYYDSSTKLQTYANGVEILGNLWLQSGGAYYSDNVKGNFGTSQDLQIYHDGNNSAINDKGTGSLYIQGSNNIYLRDYDTSENHIVMTKDGSVDLYHNGSKKFETTSSGTKTTGYHQQTAIPSFLAEHKNSDTHKKTGDLKNQFVRSFGTVRHNTGSHFSNSTGKFTAPVAGLYMFTMSMTFDKGDGVDDSAGCYFRVENNSGNYNRVHNNGRDFWNINARFFTTDGTELSQSFQSIELLDANATVGFYFTDFDDTTTELTVAFFSGHLIG